MSALPIRYLFKFIKEDLEKKMVFIGGPRQVGKTTLSQQFIKKYQDKHPAYLNWDLDEHRMSQMCRRFTNTDTAKLVLTPSDIPMFITIKDVLILHYVSSKADKSLY